jgi:hypothetical protein
MTQFVKPTFSVGPSADRDAQQKYRDHFEATFGKPPGRDPFEQLVLDLETRAEATPGGRAAWEVGSNSKYRCPNRHVCKIEGVVFDQGLSRCFCGARNVLTFPEDSSGPLPEGDVGRTL